MVGLVESLGVTLNFLTLLSTSSSFKLIVFGIRSEA